jgi:hypothetical protein
VGRKCCLPSTRICSGVEGVLEYLSATARSIFPHLPRGEAVPESSVVPSKMAAAVLLRAFLPLILPILCHGFVQFTNANFDIVQGRMFTITWAGATGPVDLYLQRPNTESFVGDTEATIARKPYTPSML